MSDSVALDVQPFVVRLTFVAAARLFINSCFTSSYKFGITFSEKIFSGCYNLAGIKHINHGSLLQLVPKKVFHLSVTYPAYNCIFYYLTHVIFIYKSFISEMFPTFQFKYAGTSSISVFCFTMLPMPSRKVSYI